MIITFDGLSGAGKSSQSRELARFLGFEVVNFDHQKKSVFEMLDAKSNDLSSICNHVILLHHASNVNTKDVIIEDPPFFSSALFALFEKQELVVIDKFLEFFNATQLRPVKSFCLKVGVDCAAARRAKRDSAIVYPSWDSKKEAELFSFYDYLNARLPYFHIIDGESDQDTVTEQILQNRF